MLHMRPLFRKTFRSLAADAVRAVHPALSTQQTGCSAGASPVFGFAMLDMTTRAVQARAVSEQVSVLKAREASEKQARGKARSDMLAQAGKNAESKAAASQVRRRCLCLGLRVQWQLEHLKHGQAAGENAKSMVTSE